MTFMGILVAVSVRWCKV